MGRLLNPKKRKISKNKPHKEPKVDIHENSTPESVDLSEVDPNGDDKLRLGEDIHHWLHNYEKFYLHPNVNNCIEELVGVAMKRIQNETCPGNCNDIWVDGDW